MLGELDAEALEGAGVQAGQEPLDDELGAQVETGDLPDHFRLQIFLGVAHADIIAGASCPRSSKD